MDEQEIFNQIRELQKQRTSLKEQDTALVCKIMELRDELRGAHQKYNFDDWENVPPMEFQAKRKGTDKWIYLSDPIEDFMNTI